MRVVKVLHGLRAQIDAQMLELSQLGVFEAEHVQNPDEAIGGVFDSVVQGGHGFAAGVGASDGGGVLTCHLRLIVNGFV